MNGLGLNLQNYASASGASGGQSSAEDLDVLNKALSAQHITGRETTGLTSASGAPLKVESLDKTLKLITFKESEIVLWKRIPKLQAFNTVEEYNQLTDYGTNRGGFIVEGELPVSEDSQYVRRSQLVKFMGVTRSVTHPMSLVNTQIGDVIAKEAKNGAMWLLRRLNESLTRANSDIVPQEFNGLYAQHRTGQGAITLDNYFDSETVVDLRGNALTESAIEDAMEGIIENHGVGTDLFAPPKVLSDFVKSFYGNKFIAPNTQQTASGIMGQRVQQFDSQFGRVNLNHDIFMNKLADKTTVTAATSTQAPTPPVAGGTPLAVVAADASSKWDAGTAGDYLYAVTAINRFGESSLYATAAATIVAGGSVDLQFVAGGGANAPTGYRIYRSNEGAANAAVAKFSPLFEISAIELANGYDGAAVGTVRDRNRLMPNTYSAFLIENSEDVHAFRQLAPLMKMDLAMVSTAYRFMVLLYGTPLLFAPKKMVRFVNIGVS